MFADIIIAIVFVGAIAGALFMHEDKVEEWGEQQHGKHLEWR